MSAEDRLIFVDVPVGAPSWFTLDWTVAADKWVSMVPGRTIEMWCALPHEWRSDFASGECALRRSRGIPDPAEGEPAWARQPWVSSGDAVGDIAAGAERMKQTHRETPHLEIPAAVPPNPIGHWVDTGKPADPRFVVRHPVDGKLYGSNDGTRWSTHYWDHETQTAAGYQPESEDET